MPTPIHQVRERDFVAAVDLWLDGGAWSCADAAYRPYRGINVRLAEDGDSLTSEGVTIVARNPARLVELPPGTRTSNRLEARALAAVAVRGDAGWQGCSSGQTRP